MLDGSLERALFQKQLPSHLPVLHVTARMVRGAFGVGDMVQNHFDVSRPTLVYMK